MPWPLPRNRVWGVDTTCVTGATKFQHTVLGIVDHGTRLNVALQYLERFNTFTFLGYLLLAIGKYGKPKFIKTDNHPVFRAKFVNRLLQWLDIKLIHSRPARPWENGRIERFFGTFKSYLRDYAIKDALHLVNALEEFQFWYNVTRTHQHLAGRTPAQAWHGIDPLAIAPQSISEFCAWSGKLRGLVLRH